LAAPKIIKHWLKQQSRTIPTQRSVLTSVRSNLRVYTMWKLEQPETSYHKNHTKSYGCTNPLSKTSWVLVRSIGYDCLCRRYHYLDPTHSVRENDEEHTSFQAVINHSMHLIVLSVYLQYLLWWCILHILLTAGMCMCECVQLCDIIRWILNHLVNFKVFDVSYQYVIITEK